MKGFIKNILIKLFGTRIGRIKIANTDNYLIFERANYVPWNFNKILFDEMEVKRVVQNIVKSGDLVFDIGANIGQYTFFFSTLVGEQGKVISYEPVKNSFAFLQINKIYNKCSQVILNNKALGGSVELSKSIFVDNHTGGRTSSFSREYVLNHEDMSTEKVCMTTLDEEIEQYGIPTLIKVDVEGFEEEVISGLTKACPNTTFIIEVRKTSFTSIYKFFSSKGFYIFSINSNGLKKVSITDDITFANLFISKSHYF